MFVVATAGHVDHGKSTVVRRLTGMEPDRWAEERRRGLTIDLGFAWFDLPSGRRLAFVDVPGHERFVPNMLAGIGPAPAAMIVVAADEGWMPQSAEHLAALRALHIEHMVLVVSKADLADPEPARRQALAELGRGGLGAVPSVAVSAVTGAGMAELAGALDALCSALPPPDPAAEVRLWVDRAFTVRGAGTVVTGTLGSGRIRVGDELELLPGNEVVRVRGLHSLSAAASEVAAVARVAVNLRGVDRGAVGRGAALATPRRWAVTTVLDVALADPPPEPAGTSRPGPVALPATDAPGAESPAAAGRPPGAASVAVPSELTVHCGSAAVRGRIRPLGHGFLRIRLAAPLPLRYGDRLLLRDPGRHRIVGGALVLDVRPPELARRGAARARAEDLAGIVAGGAPAAAASVLRRYGFVTARELRVRGCTPPGTPYMGEWYADPVHVTTLSARFGATVEQWRRAHPLASGMPEEAAARALDLPATELLPPLLAAAGLDRSDGVVRAAADDPELPPELENSLRRLETELRARPFAAPTADRLAELRLGERELAAAARAARLCRLAHGVVLLPDAPDQAAAQLAALPQPLTVAQAKRALDTTRRVAVPLLELLDRLGHTRRHPDGTRDVTWSSSKANPR